MGLALAGQAASTTTAPAARATSGVPSVEPVSTTTASSTTRAGALQAGAQEASQCPHDDTERHAHGDPEAACSLRAGHLWVKRTRAPFVKDGNQPIHDGLGGEFGAAALDLTARRSSDQA